MYQYAIRRTLQAVPILLGITILLFWLMHSLPGGPLAMFEHNPHMTPQQLAAIKKNFGLNKPLYAQYLSWLTQTFQGNLGFSFVNGRPVLTRILNRLPATALLMGSSFVLASFTALVIGVIGAVRQYSIIDYAITAFSYFGMAMPTFWFGIMAVMVFSGDLHWLPAQGIGTPGVPWSLGDAIRHLILPMVVLALFTLAQESRYVRSSMLEVIHMDYIRTARAKGVGRFKLIFKHALRNALLPVVTVMIMDAAFLFSGALVTESIFAWPGMGRLFYESVQKRDYPMLMGILTFLSFLVVFANLIADLMYGVLDPRIRYD